MRRLGLLLVVAGAIVAFPSLAETLRERVAAAQGRWVEYQELMESSDPIARSEGFNAALADENLGVRNNALWTYLHRRDRLPIELVAEPGGRAGPGDVPNVAPSNVKWNDDQRAMAADIISFGGGGNVTGQVVAGKLQIRYERLYMPESIGQSGTTASSGKTTLVVRVCGGVLAASQDRSSLEGRLTCEGMPQSLPIRMPLG